jgi:hypothetical protein
VEASAPPPTGGSNALKRYGPLIGIVVVIAVVAVVAIVVSGGDDDETAGTGTTAAGGTEQEVPEGVLSWSEAERQGITDTIDWGERCNTETGTLAYPSFFAGECYGPFTGDNGGATAPGVTADSIKVVQYLTPETDPTIDFITSAIAVDDTNDQTAETVRGFIELYSTYHELYGRSIDLEVFVGTGPSEDEVAARADAVTIAEEIQPFAVLGGPLLTPAFADELAAREILCIGCTPSQDPDFYLERAPYVWGVGNNALQGNTHLAEYLGKRLAGSPAEYAGDSALQTQTRKFGIVYLSTSEASEEVIENLQDQLGEYDAEISELLSYTSPIDLQTTAPQYIARLKDAGVTSVIFTGDPIAPQPLTRTATEQGYRPEWIITGSVLTDTAAFARSYDQEQWAHAFGVSPLAARVSPQVQGTRFLHQWYFGRETPTETGSPTVIPSWNLLFSVLQGVGPDLTAANFERALFDAEPTTRAVSQPSLSYGDKGLWPFTDYLGIDDATEIWWDPTATGPDEIQREGTGLWRFVQGGKRYLPGEWPDSPPNLFDQVDTTTIYQEPPPGEEPVQYPSPAGG